MNEPEQVTVHATLDEALAEAVGDAEDGTVVTIHDEQCATGDDEECDCTPDVIVVQRGAA